MLISFEVFTDGHCSLLINNQVSITKTAYKREYGVNIYEMGVAD